MRFIFLLLILITFTNCDKNEITRNPYLYETNFKITINTNLPKYIKLQSPPSVVYVGGNGSGIKGIYLTAISKDNYLAWEAACPNINPNNCNRLEVEGLTAKCPCNDNLYSLVNGSIIKSEKSKKQYPLLGYRVSTSGNTITIFN